MTYLAFIIGVGLYWFLGAGGPLHRDGWFAVLQRRVDATEPSFWMGFALLVGGPVLVAALCYGVLLSLLGKLGVLVFGVGALFFAFGRADYPTLVQRFLARCRAGDEQAAMLLLDEAGASFAADDADSFARNSARALLYEGFQRWFPPVFYFVVLGPLWAIAYRLIQMSAEDRQVPVGSLRHLVDWLPSRLLLVTFALVGSFDRCKDLITESALDPEIETNELLLEAIEAGFELEDSGAGAETTRVDAALRRAMAVWVIVISVIAML